MIKRLAHVCLGSSNLDASLKFYIEGLGLERQFDFIKDGKLIGFYLKAGDQTFIEIFKSDIQAAPAGAPLRHLCLEVDDIDQTVSKLRDAGFIVGEKSLGSDHSWLVWTHDPDGVAVEFHQYTPESCQYTKKPCNVDW